MDLEAVLRLHMQLTDRSLYPAAEDVLRVLWQARSMADRATEQGDPDSATSYRLLADRAQLEYRQRCGEDVEAEDRPGPLD